MDLLKRCMSSAGYLLHQKMVSEDSHNQWLTNLTAMYIRVGPLFDSIVLRRDYRLYQRRTAEANVLKAAVNGFDFNVKVGKTQGHIFTDYIGGEDTQTTGGSQL